VQLIEKNPPITGQERALSTRPPILNPASKEIMTSTQSLMIVLLLACRVAAQDVAVASLAAPNPAVPGLVPNETMPPDMLPEAPLPITPASPQPQPVKLLDRKVLDKKFFFVMAALGGAESLRFTTRKLVIEHEYAAGAPWVTHVPSNPPAIARNAALFAAELLVAYELKKPHGWLPGDRILRKLWWTYPAAMATIHIKNAVGNIRTQGPGGCTTIECAMQMQ